MLTLREIARALNTEEFLRPEDPVGKSTSRKEQRKIVTAQNEERREFEERRAFEVRK